MISIAAYYGGPHPEYDLPVQRQDVQPILDRWYDNREMRELIPVDTGHVLDKYPIPSPIAPPRPQIGKLYFPGFGASRFAFATYLIDHYTLGLLRADLDPFIGTVHNAVSLKFRDHETDDGETAREFLMYMVAERPLVNPDAATPPVDEPSVNDLYIITLVDIRYYWQFQQGVAADSASWTELIGRCTLQLVYTPTPTFDTISSDYGTPTNDLWTAEKLFGVPTAAALDAIAAQVGMRVVVNNLGVVSIQGPTTANYDAVTTFNTNNAGRLHFGGRISLEDQKRGMVRTVTTLQLPDNTKYQARIDTTLGSLSLTGFGTGCPYGNMVVRVDNNSTAYATQWAKDWYNWQNVPLDAEYVGVPEGLVFSGFIGHYEIYHTGDACWTRVARPPMNYSTDYATDDTTTLSADKYTPFHFPFEFDSTPFHPSPATSIGHATSISATEIPETRIVIPAGLGKVIVRGTITPRVELRSYGCGPGGFRLRAWVQSTGNVLPSALGPWNRLTQWSDVCQGGMLPAWYVTVDGTGAATNTTLYLTGDLAGGAAGSSPHVVNVPVTGGAIGGVTVNEGHQTAVAYQGKTSSIQFEFDSGAPDSFSTGAGVVLSWWFDYVSDYSECGPLACFSSAGLVVVAGGAGHDYTFIDAPGGTASLPMYAPGSVYGAGPGFDGTISFMRVGELTTLTFERARIGTNPLL